MKRLLNPLTEFFRRGDIFLLAICALANLFGLILVYSATRYSPDLHNSVYRQLIASLLGVACYIVLSFVDIELLVDKLWKVLLLFNAAFLLLLIPFGMDGGTGNKSWLSLPLVPFNVQPAEVVKLSFILLLAAQFSLLHERDTGQLSVIIQTAGHAMALCVLIAVVSSDMGMVLVYLSIYAVIAWAAGVKLRWFAAGGGAAAILGYAAWPHLPQYIQMRLLVVFDHNLDPLGKGFHQTRSILAIGSGRLTGQGYLNGTQTQSPASSSLPARHTDFIFSVAAEELGLIGCLLILALLLAIILRCVWVSRTARSPMCAYTAMGLAGMLMVHTVLNVGMCLFVSPVVGLTLPFFSYGGSSILVVYAAMGIVSGIKMRSLPSWLRDRSNI